MNALRRSIEFFFFFVFLCRRLTTLDFAFLALPRFYLKDFDLLVQNQSRSSLLT